MRRLSPVSLSVFSLVPHLLFDCSRVPEYAKIRTVLQSISKVNYACSVFHPLPAFQMKRLQRLQNACAGFVTRKFAGVENVVKQIRNISASAATILSKLPVAIRNITEYNSFSRSAKRHLLCKEL